MTMDLSIIIVNYHSEAHIQRCVESIKQFTSGISYEIIVVDNSDSFSSDPSEAHVINSGYNAGFARANNLGIKQAKGKFVLLLNPDTWISTDVFTSMVDFYKKNEAQLNLGLLGCRLEDENGQLLKGTFPEFPGISKFWKQDPIYIWLNRKKEKNTIADSWYFEDHSAAIVSGACVMFRREKIQQEDLLLDEDFFLYSEDTEWCYRVQQSGKQNYYLGSQSIHHINSGITGNSNKKKAQIRISELLYFYKTSSPAVFSLLRLLLWFNFQLNKVLSTRRGLKQELKKLSMERAQINSYIREIRINYKRKPSSGDNYLIYDQKDPA